MPVVYQHIRNDTKEIFYVGIGRNAYRAYSKSGRNKYWHNIVNKYGYDVQIIHADITMNEAKKIEIKLIKQLGKSWNKSGSLTNITDGGDDCNTNIGRVCLHKGDKETYVLNKNVNLYLKTGWKLGRSQKTRINIGKANSISQLGKKHSPDVIEKMKGPRDFHKTTKQIINKVISLYKKNYTLKDIGEYAGLSFPTIMSILKKHGVYNKKTIKVKCIHCKKIGSVSNMKRYHFDNCKLKKL